MIKNGMLLIYLLSLFVIVGCAETIQPKIHSVLGTSLMIVPEGTKIGDQVAPEEGLFIGKSLIIPIEIKKDLRQDSPEYYSRNNLGRD